MTGAVLAGILALAACSSSGPSASSTTTTGGPTTVPATTTTVDPHPPCTQGATIPKVTATPVAGTPSDFDMTSFDGTKIRIHWFPAPGAGATRKVPTILMGPGWSLPGDTLAHPAIAFGALDITTMNKAGYNVLTWDPRGFGKSGGNAEVDSTQYEGRDGQVMLDWISEQPEARPDRPGDPRAGMVGFSYGGGIQLTLASIDCRVDALVPGIAWHSLETSLYKADTVKAGWSGILSSIAGTAHLDPHITSAAKTGLSEGLLSEADRQWFVDRGPGDGIDHVTVPTLFVQGTVDTLFTLDEAITNYRSLRQRGIPTAMLWFCGGHGTCLTKAGDPTAVATASFAWLDRYLKGEKQVKTGPRLDLVDQDGVRWTGDDYPVALAAPVTATGSGTLALDAASAAGPLPAPKGPADLLSGLVGPITPAKAATALDLNVDSGSVDALALGAPHLTLTYSGTSPSGVRPLRAFAQLVDESNNVVVDNQITPIALKLDGRTHTADVDMEVIAQHLEPGHPLTLQLVATTVAYAIPRLGGTVTFSKIALSIPVAKGVTKA